MKNGYVEVPDVEKDLEHVELCLIEARKYKLEAEVVLFALYAMRDYPTLLIKEAMDMGMGEWIK